MRCIFSILRCCFWGFGFWLGFFYVFLKIFGKLKSCFLWGFVVGRVLDVFSGYLDDIVLGWLVFCLGLLLGWFVELV